MKYTPSFASLYLCVESALAIRHSLCPLCSLCLCVKIALATRPSLRSLRRLRESALARRLPFFCIEENLRIV